MRMLHRLLIVAALFAFLVVVPAAQAANVHLFTRLAGSAAFPHAAGHSDYERTATHRSVDVTVTHIASLAGKRLGVFVNGTKVGTMRVSSTGRAHRDWDTDHGQSVPFAAKGDLVKVRKHDGTLVAKGTYHRDVSP